jgi:hypothetical protein
MLVTLKPITEGFFKKALGGAAALAGAYGLYKGAQNGMLGDTAQDVANNTIAPKVGEAFQTTKKIGSEIGDNIKNKYNELAGNPAQSAAPAAPVAGQPQPHVAPTAPQGPATDVNKDGYSSSRLAGRAEGQQQLMTPEQKQAATTQHVSSDHPVNSALRGRAEGQQQLAAQPIAPQISGGAGPKPVQQNIITQNLKRPDNLH